MKYFKRKSFTLLFLALFLILSKTSCMAHILKVTDGKMVSFSELIDEIKPMRVIFIGELHDNLGHHRAQLQVINALKGEGIKLAIGLEMFRSDNQSSLDRWVSGGMDIKEFLPIYQQNWSFWNKYKDIYTYARDNKIPLVGLNLSREITKQVARNGFNSLSNDQLAELPVVRCVVDPAYKQFIKRALGGHGQNGPTFDNFCEAQLLWDMVMAKNLLDYLQDNPDTTVVVLAGNGHSWKYGIPNQFDKLIKFPYRVLLPEIPGRLQEQSVTVDDTDYLLLGADRAPLH